MAPLVWLVTGTSSGLGLGFIHAILARSDKCIATARSTDKISHLSHPNLTILPLDVTSPQSTITSTISEAISIHGHIDVLVNNAGFIQIGTVEELEYEDWRAQFETNVFGAVKVAKAVLPHFRARRSGTIVFVSSLSGWIGHEACGAYAGSKFAMEGIAESLHRETSPLNIRTLLLEPGRFRTNLLSQSNMKTTAMSRSSKIPDYAALLDDKMAGLAAEDGNQPGDPDKLVSILVDVVRGEGVAEGKTTPFRLALGRDCVEGVRGKCVEVMGELGVWEGVGGSTDF